VLEAGGGQFGAQERAIISASLLGLIRRISSTSQSSPYPS